MHYRMPDPPPEVKKELEALFLKWEKSESELDFCNFSKRYGSDALHKYDEMCDSIRASLQPGEHV